MIYECSSYAYRGRDIKSGKRHGFLKKNYSESSWYIFSECVKKNKL